MVMLGGVNYYTGQAFDMKTITEAGHRVGAMVGFDLAHAAGNLELQMHDWDVDFAVLVFIQISQRRSRCGRRSVCSRTSCRVVRPPRFAGWWGHDKESRFPDGPGISSRLPVPKAGRSRIRRYCRWRLCERRSKYSTRPECRLLRRNRERLTGYLEALINEIGDERISIITPPPDRTARLSDFDRS